MIDRFGNMVRIGWAEHELLWLDAAISLPKHEHTAAFQDIAEMTGRSFISVQSKAYSLHRARLDAERTRRLVIPARALPCPQRSRMAPSELKQPTKAQLMGARA